MPVIRLESADLAALGGRLATDPAVAKLYELLKAEAERRGGTALAVWKLHMARLWGEPLIMTSDEVARRLNLPVSQVTAIINSTKGAVRDSWMASQEYRSSHFND